MIFLLIIIPTKKFDDILQICSIQFKKEKLINKFGQYKHRASNQDPPMYLCEGIGQTGH